MSNEVAVLETVTVAEFTAATDTVVVVAGANIGTAVSAGSAGSGHTIQDEGTARTQRTNLNFVGASVAVTDDSGNDATVVTISGGSGHTIQDEGGDLTARTYLNFVGAGVAATDDSGNDATVVTIAGGGAVDSVNSQTGAVVLDADDISDAATTNKWTTAADISKLAGIEAAADVTDAANVAAAGAHMAGGTDVPVADGGTGASTAADARTNLGLVIGTDVLAFAHEADTTSVHGIADTSVLETTTGAQSKVDTHVNDTSDAHDASAISVADAGTYFTGTDVEAVTQEIGASLASVDLLSDLLAGVTVPFGSLSRWKAGPGIPATKLAEDLTSGETDVDVVHAGVFPDSVPRLVTVGTEECLDAGSGTTTRTWTRGVNGTTAAAQSTGASVFPTRLRTVVGFGDSIVQGTYGGTDAYFNRAFRVLGQRFGGVIGEAWPLWRNVDITQSATEWDLTGSYTPLSAVNDYALCPYGSIIFTSGSGNYAVWTRPPWVTVQAFDLIWVDPGTTGDGWSYSIDGGTTWVTNPSAGTGSTGDPKLRRLRVTCDNPTDIRVRAANSAGTGEGFTLPYMPLVTYSTAPTAGVTEGVRLCNLGWDGQRLRVALGARSAFDASVTNGDATVTSASSAFVTGDVGGRVYVGPADGTGMWTTIASRTSGTEIELAATYTGTTNTNQQITIFQDGVGDYMRLFSGDAGSLRPDLLVCGPWSNDEAVGDATLGDTNPEAMRAMLQYVVDEVQPFCDILLVARYEADSGVSDQLQADYRQVFHDVAAANDVAVCDLYDAFAAGGYTGGPAMTAAGFLQDTIHMTQTGHNFAADYLTRVLGVL